MAVPAHDSRDMEFAKKFGLKIVPVIENNSKSDSKCEVNVNSQNSNSANETSQNSGEANGKNQSSDEIITEGTHINSDFLNGLDNKQAIEKMINWLEEKKIGA